MVGHKILNIYTRSAILEKLICVIHYLLECQEFDMARELNYKEMTLLNVRHHTSGPEFVVGCKGG